MRVLIHLFNSGRVILLILITTVDTLLFCQLGKLTINFAKYLTHFVLMAWWNGFQVKSEPGFKLSELVLMFFRSIEESHGCIGNHFRVLGHFPYTLDSKLNLLNFLFIWCISGISIITFLCNSLVTLTIRLFILSLPFLTSAYQVRALLSSCSIVPL